MGFNFQIKASKLKPLDFSEEIIKKLLNNFNASKRGLPLGLDSYSAL